MINTHVHRINNDKRKMNRDPKIKNSELYEVQIKYMELVDEVMDILNGKKGQLRSLVGGQLSAQFILIINCFSFLIAGKSYIFE